MAKKKAIQRFEREAPQEEVDRFHAVQQTAREGNYRVDEAGVTQEWKWLCSLILWEEYREKGEQVVLERLPLLLLANCNFFLGQWWVRELVSAWHSQGEEEKIKQLFFGSTKGTHGMRGFQRTMQDFRRDAKIYVEVEKLLAKKDWSDSKIYKWIRDNLQEFSIKKQLSPGAVRKIHKEFGKKGNPFKKLFPFP